MARSYGIDANVKLVKLYSWITFVAILYGICWAHIPALMGTPWDSCNGACSRLWCILTFHLYEVPIVIFGAYLGWYGLTQFSTYTMGKYRSLLLFSATLNSCFVTFEIISAQGAMMRNSPEWELIGLLSLSAVLIGGVGLTIYLHQRLVPQP